MRAYFFVNSALSSIQKGIQVAHCLTEMAVKSDSCQPEEWEDWASDHKTIVVLEGGFHKDLRNIVAFFKRCPEEEDDHLWASFSEDKETMNGMMTCVGIIVPSKIYEMAKAIRESSVAGAWDQVKKEFSSWELSFIELLNSCPLAH